MNIKKYILGLGLIAGITSAKAQGLEGIIVERYYQANAADAQYTVDQGYTVPLTTGAVTYRVYVDMAAGYKFVQMFGTATKNLTFATTSSFYNDENYDSQTAPTTSAVNTKKHTAMIDSWITAGGAAGSKVGVPKDEDTDGSIANPHAQGILGNTLGGCFGSQITGATGKDGLMASSGTTYTAPNTLGMGGTILDALVAGNALGSITITNGSIASLGGIVGATSSNKVLVGQFTTSGTFTFTLNIQLLSPTGAAENYVHGTPGAGQLTHPTLVRTAGGSPSVSIVSNDADNSICAGTSVTFTATPTNGGTPSYQWKLNGTNVGTDATTYTNAALANNDVVSVVMTAGGCDASGSATSNNITTAVVNTTNYYTDADGDGYGTGTATSSCSNPGAGYATVNGDCNDASASVNPGATEICNGIDDNCTGGIDNGLTFNNYYTDADGDNYGTGTAQSLCANPGAGYTTANGDCNDGSSSVNPGATEICNGIDDNCTGGIDNGLTFTNYYSDADGDNYGTGTAQSLCANPGAGYATANGDCNDNSSTINPGANEICNGIDDNCTGGIDNGLTFNNYYTDADGDNFGTGAAQSLCANPGAGYSTQTGDCNDNNSAIKPGATEVCGNSIDEDCSGSDLSCSGGNTGIGASVTVLNIGTFNTGVQSNVSVNLNNGTDTPENPGAGLELWYNFTAQSNAVRIQLTGSSSVADDNDLSIFDTPTTTGSALIPLAVEDDVHPGAQGAAADGGSETLLFDGLTVGDNYSVCVRNNNNAPGTVSMRIAFLRASQTDIGPYTNYTGIFANNCQNFKAKFRSGASGYTVKRFNVEANASNGSVADWSFAIPPGASTTTASTVCQLGRIVPPNLGTSNVTYYVTVDAHYNLPDAFGTLNPITAIGTIVGPIVLAPEAALTVRASDQCPAFKFLTSSLATNRSICGTSLYNWEFTQTLPTPGVANSVNGGLGGSRILPMSLIPAIGLGQTHNVRIRARHADNSFTAFTASPACVRTIAGAGMPTLENEGTISTTTLNNASIALYPNPNNGEMVQLSVTNFEGNLNVEILDATGRMIQKENIVAEGSINKMIEFNNELSNGMYHVKVSNGSETSTVKFVVSK
ncbi:MAG: hypothetical protein RLY35_1025 [Bacteroidota bacterium]|jgi:hypothetical protein